MHSNKHPAQPKINKQIEYLKKSTKKNLFLVFSLSGGRHFLFPTRWKGEHIPSNSLNSLWMYVNCSDWNGLPFSSPGDLPDPGSAALQADSLPFEPPGRSGTRCPSPNRQGRERRSTSLSLCEPFFQVPISCLNMCLPGWLILAISTSSKGKPHS